MLEVLVANMTLAKMQNRKLVRVSRKILIKEIVDVILTIDDEPPLLPFSSHNNCVWKYSQ